MTINTIYPVDMHKYNMHLHHISQNQNYIYNKMKDNNGTKLPYGGFKGLPQTNKTHNMHHYSEPHPLADTNISYMIYPPYS